MLKNFFGENLDFPKIKKMKKLCYYVWICTKMWNYFYFQVKLTLKLLIAFKIT